MSDGYAEEMRNILSAVDLLARETGGSPVSEKACQVHQVTLQKVLGEGYRDLIVRMFHADFIDVGLDDVNNEAFEFSFTERGIESLKRQTQQVREQRLAVKEERCDAPI
jgi:hypothetical protein